MNRTDDNNNLSNFYIAFVFAFAFIATFLVTLKICSQCGGCDFIIHARWADDYSNGRLKMYYPVYYILLETFSHLFRMSQNTSIAFVQSFMNVLSLVCVYFISKFYISKVYWIDEKKIAYIVLFMAFFGPLYAGTKYYYLGPGSYNPWHNPTLVCVKPVALVCFYMFCFRISNNIECINVFNRKVTLKLYDFILSVLILFSCICKTSFYQVFAPTVTCIVIIQFLRKKLSFLQCVDYVKILVPATIMILFQLLNISFSGEAGRGIGIGLFLSSRAHGLNIRVIILGYFLAVAFPIFIFLFCKSSKRNISYYSSVVFYLIAFFQAAFLYEKVDTSHGNFGWGYLLSLGILFLYSIFEFINYMNEEKHKFQSMLTIIGYLLLSSHFIFGIWFFIELLFVRNVSWF